MMWEGSGRMDWAILGWPCLLVRPLPLPIDNLKKACRSDPLLASGGISDFASPLPRIPVAKGNENCVCDFTCIKSTGMIAASILTLCSAAPHPLLDSSFSSTTCSGVNSSFAEVSMQFKLKHLLLVRPGEALKTGFCCFSVKKGNE